MGAFKSEVVPRKHILFKLHSTTSQRSSWLWTKTKRNVEEFLLLELLPFLCHWLALLLGLLTLISVHLKILPPPVKLSLNFLCRFSCITIYDLLALAIVVIWLVIGSAMTFKVFDTVNLDIEGSASFCPAFLYRFTYSTAILGWIFVAMALVFGLLAKFCSCFWNIICCKPC